MPSVFTSGHVKAAMIVAPILAVLAYLGVDSQLAEKPQAAQSGQSYPLAAQPNCRYESGVCTLKNNDVKLDLRVSRLNDSRVGVVLESELSLDGALVTISSIDELATPTPLSRDQNEQSAWYAELMAQPADGSVIRLVVSVLGARYFAEVPTGFIDYQTPYSRDNFAQPVTSTF